MSSLVAVIEVSAEAITVFDVAFLIFIIGMLLLMAGVFGDPNLVVVGIAVTGAGLVGLVLGPYSPTYVIAGLIPLVGFAFYWLVRKLEWYESDAPEQTSSAQSLLGKRGRITEPTNRHRGQIKVDGGGFNPYYQCRTRDGTLEVGDRAIVIERGGGNVLTVATPDSVDEADIQPNSIDTTGWKVVDDLEAIISRLFQRNRD